MFNLLYYFILRILNYNIALDLVFYWKAIPKLNANTRNENYNCRGEKRNIVNYKFLNNGRLK